MQHTAARAGYEPETLTVTTPADGGLTRHFVMTRHGAVRRTFLPGPLLVEVALWRPRNARPQYQGTVTHEDGLYVATNSRGQVVARRLHYVDAEAALLPLRMRKRSAVTGTWPEHICRDLQWRREGRPAAHCPECGHDLPAVGAECSRPDLHW